MCQWDFPVTVIIFKQVKTLSDTFQTLRWTNKVNFHADQYQKLISRAIRTIY